MKTILSRLPIVLAFSLFAVLLNTIGSVILQVIETLGVSKAEAAWLEAFKDPPAVIGSLFAASIVAAIGIKRTLAAGVALALLASVLLPSVPTYTTVRLSFAMIGVGFALARIASMAAIGRFARDAKAHLRFLAALDACFTLSAVGGIWLFGGLAGGEAPLSWLGFYWVAAALSVIALVGVLLLRLPKPVHADDHAPVGQWTIARRLLGEPLVFAFLVCTFLFVLIEQSIATWLPTYNHEIIGLSAPLAIQAASIFVLATALGRILVSLVARRFSWYVIATAGILAGTLVLVVVVLASRPHSGPEIRIWSGAPLRAYLYPLIGLTIGPIYPIINSAILSSQSQDDQPAMAALIAIFSALGGVIGSLFIGFLFQHIGGTLAFRLLFVPVLLLWAGLYLMRRFQRAAAVIR